MSEFSTLHILENEPYGVISPWLYGHFAEHLGRCCYDGLWVGLDSEIPNVDGFRKDVVDALRVMPTPFLRWPGGCYADHYHWRDGIGPPQQRPSRLGISCGLQVLDDNSLGTHEFLRLCELIGAEPYLAGNMGSGSVQEMCDWVEYCNSVVPTSLARERGANGREIPFGVSLWGVGNENWGCGGSYEPESYGLEYRRYATMLKHVDPSAELVACGNDSAWQKKLAHTLRDNFALVDHYSIHRYWVSGGTGTEFTEEQYYRLLAEADKTEAFVQETRVILDEYPGAKHVGIALDEWGVWHSDARGWGPDGHGDLSNEYAQAATMRDALAAAVALEGFHRQCAVLSMANLAQVVNVLHAPIQTDGSSMWLAPTYHLLQMHSQHIGAESVRVFLEDAESVPGGGPAVSATASRREGRLAVTLVNRHFSKSMVVRLPFEAKSATLLAAEHPREGNSAAAPDRVVPRIVTVRTDGDGCVLEMPPASVATVAR